jgi:hypothetical protein
MDDLIKKLQELKPEELDYVMARSSTNSIASACKEANLSQSTVYRWDNRDQLDELAAALRLDRHIEVELKLRDALPDAVQVVIEGLKERRYDTKFKAAVEILDRTMGKATQKIDQNVNASGEIIVTLRKNDAQSDD